MMATTAVPGLNIVSGSAPSMERNMSASSTPRRVGGGGEARAHVSQPVAPSPGSPGLQRLTSASSIPTPPFLSAALRRGSDQSANAVAGPVGGLARRLPFSTAASTAEAERNQLLRSVSHLSKDQSSPMPAMDATEGSDGVQGADRPFTRFDLLPPPNYQRVRNPRKPSYGVRGGIGGRSFSERRRGMYDTRSSSMQETFEVDNSRSQIGFSHAYKSGNGRAKAMSVAAAAKIRRMSMSQLSSRKASNDVSGGGSSREGTAARQVQSQQEQEQQEQQGQQEQRQQQTRNEDQSKVAQGSPITRPRAFTAPTSRPPSQASSSSGPTPVTGPIAAGERYSSKDKMSRDTSPALGLPNLSSPSHDYTNYAGQANTNQLLGAGGANPNAIESGALENYKTKAHSRISAPGSASPISQDPQAGVATISATTTTADRAQADPAHQSTSIRHAVVSDAENDRGDAVDEPLPVHPSRAGAFASATNSKRASNFDQLPLKNAGEESASTSRIEEGTSPSKGTNTRISFDTATRFDNLAASLDDAPGPPHDGNTAASNSSMTEVSDTLQSRRGSAPTDSVGRRKSAFRLGLMKLSGSTVDLTSLSSKPQSRRGSHLEASSKARSIESEDRLDARPDNIDGTNRSRLSLSLGRRLQQPAQDSPRSNASSFMGKFNKSRDQLPTGALSMDEVRRGSLDKTQKNDSSSAARQFLLRAFRRPSQPQAVVAPSTNTVAPPTSTTPDSYSNEDMNSQSSASPAEDTEEILESAFGPLQRSDAQSAQAFEGREARDVTAREGVAKTKATMSRENSVSATRRSSRDSASTSFFSVTDGSLFPSRGDSSGGLPFDRSRNVTKGTEQSSRSQSAVRLPGADLEEEGPLGERRLDMAGELQDSPAVAYLKMNMAGARPANAVVTSPSEQSSSATHQTVSTVPSSLHPVQSLQDETFAQDDGPQAAKVTPPTTSLETTEGATAATQPTAPTPAANQAGDNVTSLASGGGGGSGAGGDRDAGENSRSNSRRPAWSSRLSHLPRLNSMRAVSGASTTAGDTGEADDDDDEGDDERRRGTAGGSSRRPSEEQASDTDTGDEEGSETESELATEDEAGSEADTSAMPGSLPEASSMAAVAGGGSSSSGTRARPGDISLPPVPTFGATSQAASSSTVSAATPAANPNGTFAVGQSAWTRFEDVMTPFETPRVSATPTLSNPSGAARSSVAATTTGAATQRTDTNSGTLTQTPLAMAETDKSYFDIKSTTGRTANGMPPPSPSIITRSRAASNGSKRSLKSPSYDIPPLPPMTPLQLQTMEGAKGSGRITAANYLAPVPTPGAESSGAAIQRVSSPASMLMRPPSVGSSKDVARSPEQSGKVAKGSTSSMPPPPVPSPVAPSFKSVKRQDSARPSLYQQQSRSLIDLSAMAARQTREDSIPTSPFPPGIAKPSRDSVYDASNDSSVVQSPSRSATPVSGVRRRRSMYEVGAQPPPYAIIHKRPEGPQMIFPREEEGKESLPNYSCSVHIEGYLPRKMEFSSPGIQAKDRSWRRQYFVLHGTCLKVYKTDLSGENLVGKGAWGRVEGVHVHTEPMNEDGPSAPPPSSGTTTANGKEPSSATASGHVGGGGGSSGLNAAVEVVNALTGSFNVGGSKATLVKTYSLQGAESGLAADYLKRRHVVRVRVEGEQFLLQTRNDRHVVDWIEAFQAATNVSLDLERRPMPKFITLPRRRRRRRRGDAAAGDPSREASELQEAQRRSLLEAQGNGRGSARALPPARPLGLPGDESPDASTALDDMLREDQDDLMRREAADV